LAEATRMLQESDLIVAQEFLPTDYDWRIGVLEGRPLFACRYHMARRHWQIVRRSGARSEFGRVDCVPIEEVPRRVVTHAVRAARLIGRGLYGVDVKQAGRRVCVIEVNDNPNMDAGVEDAILGRALYDEVMQYLLRSVENRHRT